MELAKYPFYRKNKTKKISVKLEKAENRVQVQVDLVEDHMMLFSEKDTEGYEARDRSQKVTFSSNQVGLCTKADPSLHWRLMFLWLYCFHVDTQIESDWTWITELRDDPSNHCATRSYVMKCCRSPPPATINSLIIAVIITLLNSQLTNIYF